MIRIDNGLCEMAVEIQNGKVVTAPPLVSFMKGWPEEKVYDYCRTKAWRAFKV